MCSVCFFPQTNSTLNLNFRLHFGAWDEILVQHGSVIAVFSGKNFIFWANFLGCGRKTVTLLCTNCRKSVRLEGTTVWSMLLSADNFLVPHSGFPSFKPVISPAISLSRSDLECEAYSYGYFISLPLDFFFPFLWVSWGLFTLKFYIFFTGRMNNKSEMKNILNFLTFCILHMFFMYSGGSKTLQME